MAHIENDKYLTNTKKQSFFNKIPQYVRILSLYNVSEIQS